MDKYQEQALCLAGVVQAATLVDRIAHDQAYEENHFTASIKTLFKLNPDSIENVFTSRQYVALGLKSLQSIVENKNADEMKEIYRYTLNILILERKLNKNPEMQNTIRDRLKITVKQAQQLAPSHEVVLTSLANIYQSTMSTLAYKIQIVGDKEALQNQDKTTKMRALLFAGIRSAILWYQMGGRQRHLLFNRGRVLKAIAALLTAESK